MAYESSGMFDFWTLFVALAFGNFWTAVIGIMLLMYFIMSFLGKVSLLSSTWFVIMFFTAMTLGWGYSWLSAIVTIGLISMFTFSMIRYLNSEGQ